MLHRPGQEDANHPDWIFDGEEYAILEYFQFVVWHRLTVEGSLIVEGTLVVFD